MQPQQMQPGMMQMQPMQSDKNWVAGLLLGLLGIFGIAGIVGFYTGSIHLGFLKLITFGGLGIGPIIDVILVVTGSYKDENGKVAVVN